MIKFTTWNLENFFIRPSLKYPHRILKLENKVQKIAEVLQSLSSDFLFLTEVGGAEDLRHFNESYLDDEYEVFFKKGNSNRGIELGLLAKKETLKERNWEVKIVSHAQCPISFLYPHEVKENKLAIKNGFLPAHKGHKMSRDLLQVEVYAKDKRDTPVFILLGVHFKSKLDKEGIDWNGQRRRQAESRYTSEVYEKLNLRYHGKVPIFLTGDFNGEAHGQKREPEFRDLYALNLEDFSEELDLPEDHRYTFIGMDKQKKPVGLQLDYFFMPQSFGKFLNRDESGFYRYISDTGEVYPIPQNPGAKFALPSDHYPIVISFHDDAFSS